MDKHILVLGGTGMLGSMMVRLLQNKKGVVVEYTDRKVSSYLSKKMYFDARNFIHFDNKDDFNFSRKFAWIINCIGITKPIIDQNPTRETKSAIEINALFPHLLAQFLSSQQQLIQIATDCVFSGKKGEYLESDFHDAEDVYGKTKSLGEVNLPNVMHLRCSIIGPEKRKYKRFLLEWLLGQPQKATINGFINHWWNGITTLHFARICAAIINDSTGKLFKPGVHHLIPQDKMNKAELLKIIAKIYKRNDLTINEIDKLTSINRVLTTHNPLLNHVLWLNAGYELPPTIEQMITELYWLD